MLRKVAIPAGQRCSLLKESISFTNGQWYYFAEKPGSIYEKLNKFCKEHEQMTDGSKRTNIKPGQQVSIVLKKDQRTGILTRGIVKTLLTKSPSHPHGIKVRLENGLVGRVKIIHN